MRNEIQFLSFEKDLYWELLRRHRQHAILGAFLGQPTLTLYISDSSMELQRVLFQAPLGAEPRVSVRGKTQGAYRGAGTFQWTPAVKALLELAELTCAWLQSGCQGDQPRISGGRGSGALSLDYAIGRAAEWVVDMFGAELSGAPVARRVFARTNSELKRPGPVTIAFNLQFLAANSIRIVCESSSCVSSMSSTPYGFDVGRLQKAYLSEVAEMLRVTPLFDQKKRKEAFRRIANNSSLTSIMQGQLELSHDIDMRLSHSARWGAFEEAQKLRGMLEKVGGLTIGVTPSQAGSIAIFKYLSRVYGLPIRLDCRFAHTSEMIGSALGGGASRPGAYVLSVASWALLRGQIKESPVSPLMIMPSASHRVIAPTPAPGVVPTLAEGRYLLMSDFPTTPRLYFEDLQRTKRIPRSRIGIQHADPDETMELLAEAGSDVRAVLWFPHDVLSVLQFNCVVVDSRAEDALALDNLLLVSAELAAQPDLLRLLDVAIRDAWLTLMARPHELARVVELIFSDARYLEYLGRFSGALRSNVTRALPSGA
jgi:hypothetical protein